MCLNWVCTSRGQRLSRWPGHRSNNYQVWRHATRPTHQAAATNALSDSRSRNPAALGSRVMRCPHRVPALHATCPSFGAGGTARPRLMPDSSGVIPARLAGRFSAGKPLNRCSTNRSKRCPALPSPSLNSLTPARLACRKSRFPSYRYSGIKS